MDEEHKPLFTCVAEIENHPNDQKLIDSCLEAYVEHFNHEQSLFTASNLYPDEEAYQHINKHDAFLATMRGLTTPVAQKWIDFAKNWLTQHIKNTDFRYKGKMPHHCLQRPQKKAGRNVRQETRNKLLLYIIT